jgi:hypothetical protein
VLPHLLDIHNDFVLLEVTAYTEPYEVTDISEVLTRYIRPLDIPFAI